MTQEEKKLLLKDLSARLPYRVKAYAPPWIDGEYVNGITRFEANLQGTWVNLENVRPYLRPMSSMTEEEKKKLGRISCEGNIEHKYGIFYRSQDYLNSIHVDYRGLIEKGLALEATEDRYKF